MMPRIIKRIVSPFLEILTRRYLSKTRWLNYQGIRIKVEPGIFHPGLFFSTRTLLRHLALEDLQGLKVLELGAGAGLLAIFCYRRRAIVTATDVSKIAIQNLHENAKLNNAYLQIIESDLFDSVEPDHFDLIIINPPYYPHDPKNDFEKVWYCGEHFEYFQKLFSQLGEKRKTKNKIIMVLSEDCDIKKITSLAERNSFFPLRLYESGNWWEKNYVFQWRTKI